MEPNATLMHLMPEVVNRLNGVLGFTPLTRNIRRVMRRLLRTAPVAPPCELLPYNENCTALRVTPQRHLLRPPPGKAALLDHVETLLRELTDADTGESVVAGIDRPSAAHDGTRAAGLPDLLVRYKAGTFPRAVVSPRLGRIEAERPEVRPGNHAAGGLLIYAGESFAGVAGVQDLGPIAARVLQSAAK
jgi:hypothetical protein